MRVSVLLEARMEFVGRQAELRLLQEWLARPDARPATGSTRSAVALAEPERTRVPVLVGEAK